MALMGTQATAYLWARPRAAPAGQGLSGAGVTGKNRV
jgi:hypothetical protein